MMGTKIYSLEYQAEVEINVDCYWGGPYGGFEVMTLGNLVSSTPLCTRGRSVLNRDSERHFLENS